jgi:hypothetical protein
MSFAEIANRRLLRSVADHLGELTWDVDPDGYQRLEATGADVDILLRLLLRRGLQPALVTMLLDRFERRPLERALIAWDVAAGSLLGPDDAELAERLRTALVPLVQLGATASVAIPRDRVGALIEAAVAAGEQPMSEGSSPQPSLASVAAETADVEAVLAFADRLSLAQLPSLALAFTQIVWHRHALPTALDRIVEIALDFERFDSMPILSEQDDRSLQLQTYFGMRVSLAQLDTNTAARVLAQMSAHPAVAASADAGLVAARAELELHSDTPVGQSNVDAVSAVAPFGSTWRYGSRVRDELRIEVAPADAAITVEGFISSFGNDMRIWAQAGYHEEARAKLLELVAREIRYQSHDPNAWRALAVFLLDGSAIELELQERSMTQLVAALSLGN